MVQPPRPWPKPPVYDDALSTLVASGDVSQVRDYFDRVFWTGSIERPGWQHLKIALLREDLAMLKLLNIWGAQPSDTDMMQLRTLAKEKYPDYLKTLRSAGIRPSEKDTPWENIELAVELTRFEIERRAYEIYARNHINGRDVENWLQAERELTAEKKAALEKISPMDAVLMSEGEQRKKKAPVPVAPKIG